jgi:putative drug exporter of the RND superfamily
MNSTTSTTPPQATPVDTARSRRPGRTGPGALARLAGWSFDRRRRVLLGWVVLLIVTSVGSRMVGSNFQDKLNGGHSESQQAQDLLKANFPSQGGDSAQVVFRTDAPISDPANQARINALVAKLEALPHVAAVQSPTTPSGQFQVSKDGHIAYATVQLDKETPDIPKPDLQRMVDVAEAARASGFEVELGGQPVNAVQQPPFGASEGIGILAAIIILLIAFGSLIAMGLPIVTALFGIGVGVGIVSLLSRWLIVPSFGTELAAMIGIGVGIDYALFIVTRYRQGLAEGRDPRAAVIRALDTSGRAVLFAGCTVVISLLGMLLLGQPFVYGLAFGAIAAVLLVMSASLTLLPALLGFAGTKIDRLSIPFLHQDADPAHNRHSFWYRWSRVIQRHPWPAALGALAVLLVLALPVFSLQMLFSDAGNDPTTLTTRHAYDLLSQGFGPGTNGPLIIAVGHEAGAPGDERTISDGAAKVAAALRGTPGIAVVAPPQVSPNGQAAVVVVVPKTSPQSGQTETLVHELRQQVIPGATAGANVKALVGGFTAGGIDAAANFSHRLVWVIGGVVLFSFLLLMVVFRSIAVPIKAAIMNLLSITAAYGVVVAVFQWGYLGGVLHIGKTGPIDPWIPVMLFTILFGLSMDYEVFLLSRIREEWLRTGDNANAVADGLAQTARVITAAAAIMFCVFGSFVVGDLRVLKVFGLGLAVAVLIDATIVRMVLVPATMELLGNVNWWFPKWLDRIVPSLDVEGEADAVIDLDQPSAEPPSRPVPVP